MEKCSISSRSPPAPGSRELPPLCRPRPAVPRPRARGLARRRRHQRRGGAAPTLPPPPWPRRPLAPVRQGQPGDPDAGSDPAAAAPRPASRPQHPPMAARLTCCLLLWALGHGGCRSPAGEGAGSPPACPVQPPADPDSSAPGRDPRGGSSPPPGLGSIAQDMVAVHMLKLYEKYNREGSRPGDGNTVRSFKARPGKTGRARGHRWSPLAPLSLSSDGFASRLSLTAGGVTLGECWGVPCYQHGQGVASHFADGFPPSLARFPSRRVSPLGKPPLLWMQTSGKRSAVPSAHRTGPRDLFRNTWSRNLVASAPGTGPLPGSSRSLRSSC